VSFLPNIRALDTPITHEDLRPLDPSEVRIQFTSLPSEAQLARLNAMLEDRPDVELRAYYGYHGTIPDLEFLRRLPALRHFSVDNMGDRLTGFDGLRHVPMLVSLGLGATKRPMSLSVLRQLAGLRRLYVEGPHRDYEAIGELTCLEDLTLRSVSLPDLWILLPLRRLRSLDLKLGGTRDLRLLPRIGRLEYLELWLIRGLDDLGPVAEVETLQHLFLQALRQVTRLPSFARSAALRRVDLETMRGLTDLSPLAEAPNLEILNLIDMRHAEPEILRPFVGHPRLRAGIWGFGSKRKNLAAESLLPLPPRLYEEPPWSRPDWDGFRSLR
jgi:internalin A